MREAIPTFCVLHSTFYIFRYCSRHPQGAALHRREAPPLARSRRRNAELSSASQRHPRLGRRPPRFQRFEQRPLHGRLRKLRAIRRFLGHDLGRQIDLGRESRAKLRGDKFVGPPRFDWRFVHGIPHGQDASGRQEQHGGRVHDGSRSNGLNAHAEILPETDGATKKAAGDIPSNRLSPAEQNPGISRRD
jgi:hypothetical protein